MLKTLAVLSDHIPDAWFSAHPVQVMRRLDYAALDATPVCAGVCAQVSYLPAVLARVDGLVLSTCCDQMRRAAEWLDDPSRVFLMNLPTTRTADALLAYEQERLSRWLDSLGARPSRATIVPEVPPPVLDGVCALPRIGVVGGHFLGSSTQADAFFRAHGLACVAWGCEGGHCIGNVYARPNEAFYQAVQQRVQEAGLSGLVVVHTTWCDLWRLAAVRLRDVLPIPVTTWIVDDATPLVLHAQACTRLEAFCELVLQQVKESP